MVILQVQNCEIIFVLGADEYIEGLEGKIREWLFFMLNYSKITACTMSMYVFLNKKGRKKKSQV